MPAPRAGSATKFHQPSAYATTAQSLPRFPSAGSLLGFPGTSRVINPSFGYPKDSETPPGRSHRASRPVCRGRSQRLARHRFSRKQRGSPTCPWGPVPFPSMAGDIWSQPPQLFSRHPTAPFPAPATDLSQFERQPLPPGERRGWFELAWQSQLPKEGAPGSQRSFFTILLLLFILKEGEFRSLPLAPSHVQLLLSPPPNSHRGAGAEAAFFWLPNLTRGTN